MENEESNTRPMIPVTELIDRHETRIGHLGRDGQIALPRAIRVNIIAAVILGMVVGFVFFSLVVPFGPVWGVVLGGITGWLLVGWAPDEISDSVPKWVWRRLSARRHRIDLPCMGAGTEPEYSVPKGGRCGRCDKDQPLDESGQITSCGLKARVYIGLALLPEVTSGTPVMFAGGLQDDIPEGPTLRDFTQREMGRVEQ